MRGRDKREGVRKGDRDKSYRTARVKLRHRHSARSTLPSPGKGHQPIPKTTESADSIAVVRLATQPQGEATAAAAAVGTRVLQSTTRRTTLKDAPIYLADFIEIDFPGHRAKLGLVLPGRPQAQSGEEGGGGRKRIEEN